jgi:hypothetical protein
MVSKADIVHQRVPRVVSRGAGDRQSIEPRLRGRHGRPRQRQAVALARATAFRERDKTGQASRQVPLEVR